MNWNLFSMYIALALLGVGMVIYAKQLGARWAA